MPTDLKALLARVEAATGPDRELDAEVCAALAYMPDAELPTLMEGWSWVWESGWTFGDGPTVKAIPVREGERSMGGATRRPQPITASLDAALALVERVRPGWFWSLGQIAWDAQAVAELCCEDPAGYAKAEAATPALALILALLRSMAE